MMSTPASLQPMNSSLEYLIGFSSIAQRTHIVDGMLQVVRRQADDTHKNQQSVMVCKFPLARQRVWRGRLPASHRGCPKMFLCSFRIGLVSIIILLRSGSRDG